MDASQRWETEALRSGSQFRKTLPEPEDAGQEDPDRNWVTLKEAEAATSIPVNTLRKWARKSAVPSFLESDGDLTLRMVDLDAVIEHAHDLGREVVLAAVDDVTDTAADDTSEETESAVEDIEETVDVEPLPDDVAEDDATDETADAPPPSPPEGTLIVPLDAWNKMLNQLGNLHEAGQQLAEARERAAKAETEATFLRERLAELRQQMPDTRIQTPESGNEMAEEVSPADEVVEAPSVEDADAVKTTSYWRYLTFGWRDRKKK